MNSGFVHDLFFFRGKTIKTEPSVVYLLFVLYQNEQFVFLLEEQEIHLQAVSGSQQVTMKQQSGGPHEEQQQ